MILGIRYNQKIAQDELLSYQRYNYNYLCGKKVWLTTIRNELQSRINGISNIDENITLCDQANVAIINLVYIYNCFVIHFV